MTTSEFVSLFAHGAWANDQAVPVNYRLALATNPPGSLRSDATWADIEELLVPSNPGYARASLTNWAKGQPYEVIAQCGGFENTGDVPWQAAHWFCVVADSTLCWLEEIDPPISLLAADRITFPGGVRFSLRDGDA